MVRPGGASDEAGADNFAAIDSKFEVKMSEAPLPSPVALDFTYVIFVLTACTQRFRVSPHCDYLSLHTMCAYICLKDVRLINTLEKKTHVVQCRGSHANHDVKQGCMAASPSVSTPSLSHTHTSQKTPNRMIYTISAIQQLTLRFSVDAVNAYSAAILVKAARILQSVLSSQVEPNKTLCSLLGESGSSQSDCASSMLCTWRPTHCIDIFLYFGPPNTIVVGLPMFADEHGVDVVNNEREILVLGTTSDGEASRTCNVEITHFSPESTACVGDIPECVCFAHLTCDQDDAGNHTMVALVYDVLVKDQSHLDMRQRYEFIRSISEPLSRVVIGNACVRVQWAGDPCMYDQLETLELPHAHHNIVLYGGKQDYRRFAFQ